MRGLRKLHRMGGRGMQVSECTRIRTLLRSQIIHELILICAFSCKFRLLKTLKVDLQNQNQLAMREEIQDLMCGYVSS